MYLLEQTRGSIDVLIHLYIYGPAGKTELAHRLKPSFETLGRALSVLEKLGLVDCSQGSAFPFRQVYDLSPAGRSLVEAPIYRWPSMLWDRSGEGLIRNHGHDHPAVRARSRATGRN